MDATFDSILLDSPDDAQQIHISMENGEIYKVIINDGYVIGSERTQIPFDPDIRRRFSVESSKLASLSDEEFSRNNDVIAWKHEDVIGTLAYIMTGGDIATCNYITSSFIVPNATMTEPIAFEDAISEAEKEANKRVEEFSRIGLGSHPMDSIRFSIENDENFVKTDIDKFILFAKRGFVTMDEAIEKSGGFSLSDVYKGIADKMESGELDLIDDNNDVIEAKGEPMKVAEPEVEEEITERRERDVNDIISQLSDNGDSQEAPSPVEARGEDIVDDAVLDANDDEEPSLDEETENDTVDDSPSSDDDTQVPSEENEVIPPSSLTDFIDGDSQSSRKKREELTSHRDELISRIAELDVAERKNSTISSIEEKEDELKKLRDSLLDIEEEEKTNAVELSEARNLLEKTEKDIAGIDDHSEWLDKVRSTLSSAGLIE